MMQKEERSAHPSVHTRHQMQYSNDKVKNKNRDKHIVIITHSFSMVLSALALGIGWFIDHIRNSCPTTKAQPIGFTLRKAFFRWESTGGFLPVPSVSQENVSVRL